ncbi:hypothetical protein [Romboutsia sp.]
MKDAFRTVIYAVGFIFIGYAMIIYAIKQVTTMNNIKLGKK